MDDFFISENIDPLFGVMRAVEKYNDIYEKRNIKEVGIAELLMKANLMNLPFILRRQIFNK